MEYIDKLRNKNNYGKKTDDIDDIKKHMEIVKKAGGTFVAKPFKAATFDKYFATFEDIDGNILQLIGSK